MDFGQLSCRLRHLVLKDLNLSRPPYFLKVMEDAGGITLRLFDTRDKGGAYAESRYVASHIMADWHDAPLDEKAMERADAMRGEIRLYERAKETADAKRGVAAKGE